VKNEAMVEIKRQVVYDLTLVKDIQDKFYFGEE
jgi:hypothetical protein